MSFWKSKVVPKFKKLFDKGKKKGALEAVKTFDGSKESIEKEIEEKTPDLHPKILEIYRSTTTIISKKLLKEPSEPAIKDNPEAAKSIVADLAKAGFPGAELLSSAVTKFGVGYLPGPVLFLFQKTSTFLVEETLPEEEATREAPIEAAEAKEEEKKEEEEAAATSTATVAIVEEEAKSYEAKVVEEVVPPAPAAAAIEEEEKKEETPAPAPAPPAAPPAAEEKKEETSTKEEEKKKEEAST